MAAPEYVPVKPMDDVRAYASPPRRPQPWTASRPGDLTEGQPHGPLFGSQGPDQGYVLTLVDRFADRLHLAEGEHRGDVIEGCVGVALKRASLLGRAPIIHDLTVAFTVWGYLDPDPPAELGELRRCLFAEAATPLHYLQQRRIADAVSDETLLMPHTKVADEYRRDWRALLDLSVGAGAATEAKERSASGAE